LKNVLDDVILLEGDLRDLSSLQRIVMEAQPQWVFHLAAQSYVVYSYVAPAATMETNTVGTLNLLMAVQERVPSARVHVCSSSEVYGQVEEFELPITEAQPFRPASPYAVSKLGADALGKMFHDAHGMDILRTRMFTHTGPRRTACFAESAFARQIVEIEASGEPGVVEVGNLDSIRTWADVRDTVRAYWLLMEKCPSGAVYNIGGTRTATIGEMLQLMKELAVETSNCGLKMEWLETSVCKDLLRPKDVTRQVPDIRPFQLATDWRPEIVLETTLIDLLNWHREQIKK
jgi:GDPmannose 4,6-dehydratase/GDP-4-dehydro-6-deoxy-D-mannose reductase